MAGRGSGRNNGNTIYGTSGDDILSAIGGSFELRGGKGDDTYIVDDASDKVSEKNRSGTDHVISYVDFALGSHLEDLTLAGTEDISATGNDSANIITGNGGANFVNGLGGDDILDGGDGADVVDGGDGTDTAVFAGLLADYIIELDGADILVTDSGGVTDILRNVEFLAFGDITVSVDELIPPPSQPVAADDSAASTEDNAIVIAVLANDNGNGLSVAAVNNGASGQVVVNDDGTLTYTPNANSHGQDSFSYTVIDAMGQTSSATVMVDVASVNDAPVAIGDNFAAPAGQVFASPASVLANDSDVDGDGLSILAYDATSQAGGTVQMNPDGNFNYAAASGFAGTDTFTYTIDDGNGGQATATVTIDVVAPPPPPPPPPNPEDPPYYVEGLLFGDPYRTNYPDDFGTADVITFSFLDAVPGYYAETSFAHDGFATFTDQQMQVTRDALAMIQSYANVTFVETSADLAEMTFGLADLPGALGIGHLPSSFGLGNTSSDIWIDASWAGGSFVPGTSQYQTLLHEVGHALGLDHPLLPDGENSGQFTVMSNLPHPDMAYDVSSFQLYDIATLQYLYGANATDVGNDIYRFDTLDGVVMTLWDAGGHDVVDLSAASYAVGIDLTEGAFSTVSETGGNNLAIAFGSVLEDAIGGAFDDRISGNESANRLSGGLGDDQLTGRGGADVFVVSGGWGDDTITDFVRGEDLLDLTEIGVGFSDLTISSTGGAALITYLADSIALQGVATVDESDFFFA